MTSRSDDRDDARAEAAALLAEMRAGLDAATGQLDRMSAEVTVSRARLDLLESIVDVLLEQMEAVVVVVDGDRQILGMSRAAIDLFDGPAIGKPLSSVLPDSLDDGAQVHALPGDGAVLVVSVDE